MMKISLQTTHAVQQMHQKGFVDCPLAPSSSHLKCKSECNCNWLIAYRQIKHEEQSHSVIAHQRQHVQILWLTTEIPNAESDGLLHEINSQRLNVILVEIVLHVVDNQSGLIDRNLTNPSFIISATMTD